MAKKSKLNINPHWLEIDQQDFYYAEAIIQRKKIKYSLDKAHPYMFFFESKEDNDKAFKLCNKSKLIIY